MMCSWTLTIRSTKFNFSFAGVHVRPMAWSDNVVVFANSAKNAAQILSRIAETLYQLGGHTVKEGSAEIIPACSRRLAWRDIFVNGLQCSVTDSFKCLGFVVTCNGDTSVQRHKMIGTLRGSLAQARKSLGQPGIPKFCRVRWWKSLLHGLIGYNAAFLGPSKAAL